MKKVAIVSCYFHKNYGSMLQAYATQKYFEMRGIPHETICCDGLQAEIKRRKYAHYRRQLRNFDVVRGKLGYVRIRLCRKNPFSRLGRKLRRRDAAFAAFQSRFTLSARYESFEALADACGNYAAVLLGSDQLWLPSNLDADFYTLNWVPEECRKISYATSFGLSELPVQYHAMAKHFLNRFQVLSAREKTGQQIIRLVSGREAALVCDPTLLLDGSEWMEIQQEAPLCREKYIFCYFLGDNPEQREFVREMRRLTGFRIVAVLHLNVYAKCDRHFADDAPFDVGPGEFLNYIRNAEYVCTDSFHAAAFSVLYHKSFFTFRRFRTDYPLETNSRLDTLLESVGLENRMLTAREKVDACLHMAIDYGAVDQKVEALRRQGWAFLDAALADAMRDTE